LSSVRSVRLGNESQQLTALCTAAVRPGLLDSGEVARVHRDVIARIRRVLERSGLNPLQLGLPPRRGEEGTDASLDSSEYEQPLLDFGDARDGALSPGLKSASVSSLVPFGPRAGLPLQRLRDPDLARAHQPSGWSIQRVSPFLARELERLLAPRGHGGSQGGARLDGEALPLHLEASALSEAP
jgi:hypothetical protein